MWSVILIFSLFLTLDFSLAHAPEIVSNVVTQPVPVSATAVDNAWRPFTHRMRENEQRYEAYEAKECKCEKFPQPVDCSEALVNGRNESGVYTIHPRSRVSACNTVDVYCDMETDGGGWTVIQRRGDFKNAENYFSKNWKSYKSGFGSLRREFWLGNDNIHALTNQDLYSARFDLRKVNGDSAFALYDNFWIADETQNYKLYIMEYSGTAGDALWPLHMKLFYTRDKTNMPEGRKPTDKQHSGGWWHNIFPSSNLNGLNKQGAEDKQKEQNGISWSTFGGYAESLAWTEIKVRPKKFNY